MLRVVRSRLTVLGEPPDNESRAETKCHADRHAKNTPESIHNSMRDLRLGRGM